MMENGRALLSIIVNVFVLGLCQSAWADQPAVELRAGQIDELISKIETSPLLNGEFIDPKSLLRSSGYQCSDVRLDVGEYVVDCLRRSDALRQETILQYSFRSKSDYRLQWISIQLPEESPVSFDYLIRALGDRWAIAVPNRQGIHVESSAERCSLTYFLKKDHSRYQNAFFQMQSRDSSCKSLNNIVITLTARKH